MPETSIWKNKLPQKSQKDSFIGPDENGYFNFDDNYGDGHVVTRAPDGDDPEVDEAKRLTEAQEALVRAGIEGVELQIGGGNGISNEIFGVIFKEGEQTRLLGTVKHTADEVPVEDGSPAVLHKNREFSDGELVESVRELIKQQLLNS